MRQALLLMLGRWQDDYELADMRGEMVKRLLRDYVKDADPGVHSAIEWLLRLWGHQKDVDAIDQELVSTGPQEDRRWFVNRALMTLAVVRGPVEYTAGAPTTRPRTTAPCGTGSRVSTGYGSTGRSRSARKR